MYYLSFNNENRSVTYAGFFVDQVVFKTGFVYCESVCTLSVQRLGSTEEQWYDNLDQACQCRHVYRAREEKIISIFRTPSIRLRLTAISFEYKLQFSVIFMAPQTMNEYFAEKSGMLGTYLGC